MIKILKPLAILAVIPFVLSSDMLTQSEEKSAGQILPKLKFDLEAEELLALARNVLEHGEAVLNRIGNVPPGSCTFDNVIWPHAQLEATIKTELAAAIFLQEVSLNKEQFDIDKNTRQDLSTVTECVAKNEEEMSKLDAESRRLVEKILLAFKQNGMYLLEEVREELKTKRKRISELGIDFKKNIAEDKTELLLSVEELEGCRASFFDGRDQRDGLYVVTMKYPDVFGVLMYAKRGDVRKKMEAAFSSRARVNEPLLEEAVQLRMECAQLLGYENHAAFRLENRMAGNVAAVMDLEHELIERLTPPAMQELEKLKELKFAETGETDFYSWDSPLEKDFVVDHEKLREYFPAETVVDEMLKIYEEILDLKFALVKDAPTWHPDVILYEVTDGSSGELMGHIYMDLFPRDGKYTHAACFELQPGYLLDRETGARQYPATAMVANFSKPTQTKPSLLKHNEVVKLFHELGHAMHNICSLANYARFHGTNVELDFAEAPSQMLENWCWDAQTLKRLSGHYLCPEEKLTNEQIAQLVRTRNVNVGLFNLGQAFLGVFDMALHSIQKPLSETFDGETVERLCSRLRGEIVLIPPQQNISYSSSFAHIMKSYDAGYYGYLWSRVFSADMFHSRFEKEGLQDARVGLDYRHKILKPGGSRDGMESLIDFLGRKPNSEAFFKSLGLQ